MNFNQLDKHSHIALLFNFMLPLCVRIQEISYNMDSNHCVDDSVLRKIKLKYENSPCSMLCIHRAKLNLYFDLIFDI